MIEELENVMSSHCEIIERLSVKEAREVWKQWNADFPLESQQPHSIRNSLIDRLLNVTKRLNGRRALEVYHNQESAELFILTLESLAGWRCQGKMPIPVDGRPDLELLVVPNDFTWTFGYRDGLGWSELLRFVYIEADFLEPPIRSGPRRISE